MKAVNSTIPAEKIERTENGKALVILHEIYGLNSFILDQKRLYISEGYDVYCPNMIRREPFEYCESEAAYTFFMENAGFRVRDEISLFIQKLRGKYDRIYMIGYSVGATIAWLCSDLEALSGVVACYGSRIRDYTHAEPVAPTLLVLAGRDSYDVGNLKARLVHKSKLTIEEFEAGHGFLDPCSEHYDHKKAIDARAVIKKFLERN